jgi:hypothetical protein
MRLCNIDRGENYCCQYCNVHCQSSEAVVVSADYCPYSRWLLYRQFPQSKHCSFQFERKLSSTNRDYLEFVIGNSLRRSRFLLHTAKGSAAARGEPQNGCTIPRISLTGTRTATFIIIPKSSNFFSECVLGRKNHAFFPLHDTLPFLHTTYGTVEMIRHR